MALTFVNQTGAVQGMNQAAPGGLITENFLRWSQDVLFDRAGLVRRRGPFSSALASVVTPTGSDNQRVIGVTSCLNPLNERVIASVIYNDNGTTTNPSEIYFYKHNGTTNEKQAGTSTLAAPFGHTTIMDSKAALGGGAWIGLLEKYGVASDADGSRQAMYFWRGGCGDETYTKAAILGVDSSEAGGDSDHRQFTTTITPNTGTFDITKINSGMFVYITVSNIDYFIGTIKTVSSANIILEKRPLRWTGENIDIDTVKNQTLKFKNVRPYIHRHGRGLVTKESCAGDNNHDHLISSGSVGTLSEGHWGAAGIGSGGYNLYTADDYRFVGIIRTDTNDNAGQANNVRNNRAYLLLNNHTLPALNADEYIMIKAPTIPSALVHSRTSTNFTGVFNATYANYQWFGCLGLEGETNRIVFSATHDPEAVDLSKDAADSIVIPGNQEMRGIASSNSGLVVFMEDKTYLIRGNNRNNFSLQLLYPEGCISTSSIVETGGGVLWASRAGILYYDGATVRNFTENNLGVYYTDGVTTFNPDEDNCYGFLYRDYAIFHFTKWNNTFSMIRYEPVYANGWATSSVTNDDPTIVDAAPAAAPGLAGQDWDDFAPDSLTWEDISVNVNEPLGWDYEAETPTNITFAIYLPTGAITTISNFAFRGATFQESSAGLKALIGFTRAPTGAGRIADIVQIDTMLDSVSDGFDHALSCTCSRLGPDLFLQTKHYTVGDPVLKKWFQRLMMNLLLERGAVRVDFVDNEDRDNIDVFNLKHKNWEVFTEKGFTWNDVENVIIPKLVSPAAATWGNLEDPDGNPNNPPDPPYTWLTLLFADYERQAKRFSIRNTSIGFRLYQLNNYRDPFQTTATIPRRIQVDSWNIGFKPLRGGRL